MSFLLDTIALFGFGAAIAFLAHRFFRDNPWGAGLARVTVYVAGVVVVAVTFLGSLGLYLDVYPFDGYQGSDVEINSWIPFLHFSRGPLVDYVAVFLFLLYPVAYVVGANVAMRKLGLGFPAIRDPIDLPRDRSVVAVADTHLGLRPNALQRVLGRGQDSDPSMVGTFLDWLPNFVPSISVWDSESRIVVERVLRKPEYVVLLGDIFEMWDGTDESLQLAMATTLPRLRHLDARIVHVVGNHDYVLGRDQSASAVARGDMQIVPDVWPGPDPSDPLDPMGHGLRPLRAGHRQYLFLHGHQFDRGFQALGPIAMVPGHLRRAARLGHYAWLFGAVVLAAIGLGVGGAFAGDTPLAAALVASLLLLAFPIVYMTVGRSLYRAFGGGRYHRDLALKGFLVWWKGRAGGGHSRRGTARGAEDLTVVCGHTHVTDVIGGPHEATGRYADIVRKAQKYPPLLVNIPSWIKDPGKDVERAIFLYLDEAGYLVLGWDWRLSRPFHIPDDLIRGRRNGVEIARALAQAGMKKGDLRSLGWPAAFEERWGAPPPA